MRWLNFAGAVLLSLCSAGAAGHAAHDGRFKIAVSNDTVRVETVLPALLLSEFDGNGDGVLSVAEFRRHEASISSWVDRHLVLTDESSGQYLPSFADMPIVGLAEPAAGDVVSEVRLMRRYDIGGGATGLRLRVGLFRQAMAAKPYVIWSEGRVAKGWLDSGEPVLLDLDSGGVAAPIHFERRQGLVSPTAPAVR